MVPTDKLWTLLIWKMCRWIRSIRTRWRRWLLNNSFNRHRCIGNWMKYRISILECTWTKTWNWATLNWESMKSTTKNCRFKILTHRGTGTWWPNLDYSQIQQLIMDSTILLIFFLMLQPKLTFDSQMMVLMWIQLKSWDLNLRYLNLGISKCKKTFLIEFKFLT